MPKDIEQIMNEGQHLPLAYGITALKDIMSKNASEEVLEYWSNLLWLAKTGRKDFTPLGKKNTLTNSRNLKETQHNQKLYKKLGIESIVENSSLASIKEFVLGLGMNIYDGTGVAPLNLFYESNKVDPANLNRLIDKSSYQRFEAFGFEGIKSDWMVDHDKRINYSVYVREENGRPITELKYIAKGKNRGRFKYDLVVEFDRTGIVSIKHVEYEVKNLNRLDIEEKYSHLGDKFRKTVDFATYFFKKRKETNQIEVRKVDEEEDFTHLLGMDKQEKLIDERILQTTPILAGGAFKKILQYCCLHRKDVINNYRQMQAEQRIDL